MDKEKFTKKLALLFQDKDFVLKLSETKSDEEAVKLFAEIGCELEAEKVKFVRDTLMSTLSGEIELSEKDLENISGGDISLSKVLGVVLVLAMAGGIGYAARDFTAKSAPKPQPASQSPAPVVQLSEAQKYRIQLIRAARKRPGLFQWVKGWVSEDQYVANLEREALANAAADQLASLQ